MTKADKAAKVFRDVDSYNQSLAKVERKMLTALHDYQRTFAQLQKRREVLYAKKDKALNSIPLAKLGR